MRYIKKIDSIPLVDGGNVIDSLETTDNPHKNAPSIAAVKELVNKVIGDLSVIFDRIYPVGSIYISVVNVNPGALFGGTWVEYAKGKVLVGQDANDPSFDTVGETGGQRNVPYTPSGTIGGHALTVNELPEHVHWERCRPRGITCGEGSDGGLFMEAGGASEYYTAGVRVPSGSLGQAHNHSFTGTPTNIGILQPYQVVKIWRRTA